MSYSDHPSQEEPTPTGSSQPKKDNSNKTTYSLSKILSYPTYHIYYIILFKSSCSSFIFSETIDSRPCEGKATWLI